MDRSARRRHTKRLVVWVGVAVIIVAALTVGYFGTPYHGTPESSAAVEGNQRVTVD